MAHTVIISSVTSVGDTCTVTGTVDGTPVTTQVWLSALGKFATALLAQSFLASAMVAALPAPASAPMVQYQGTINI